MSNLANVIKNIDPPIELTQSQYDALSSEQKNNGTIYYVTDGVGMKQVAATTPALDLNGNLSNLQAELNFSKEIVDGAPTKNVGIHTAQYLNPGLIYDRGYHTDQHGNFIQNKDDDTQVFAIRGTTEMGSALRIYWATGQIRSEMTDCGVKYLSWGAGTTSIQRIRTVGYIANSSKTIRVNLPVFSCASSGTITKIALTAMASKGGYIYMKYGSNTVSLSSSLVIWDNSAQVYANSMTTPSVIIRDSGYVQIDINFVNALVDSSGVTITNLTPVGVWVTPTIVYS